MYLEREKKRWKQKKKKARLVETAADMKIERRANEFVRLAAMKSAFQLVALM